MMKGGISVLPIFVAVIVAIAAVIAVAASFAIYVVSVITLKIFGAGGMEVIGAFGTPYAVAAMIAGAEMDGAPLLEPVLAASVTTIDVQTLSKVSAAIDGMLKNYGFSYKVVLVSNEPPPACSRIFDTSHRAVDIPARCGTPVMAFCSGTLSAISQGTGGDPVFGGTAFGGKAGLQIFHDRICALPEYTSFYGCIDIIDRNKRHVERGEIIGYVSTCGAEKEAGCHLHFGVTKADRVSQPAFGRAEDPGICGRTITILEQGKTILAKKGDIRESSITADASIPLMFGDISNKLTVIIGER